MSGETFGILEVGSLSFRRSEAGGLGGAVGHLLALVKTRLLSAKDRFTC